MSLRFLSWNLALLERSDEAPPYWEQFNTEAAVRDLILDGEPDVDFMALDWFSIADRPVDELRERFGITPKADQAVAAGSVGPWEVGGISPVQFDMGRKAAETAGRPHDTYGATP